MKYTLNWGPMGCVISPTRVIPLSEFKTSYTLKEDSGTDTSGSEAIIQKGMELQPVSFTIVYAKATGNDPLARLTEWAGLVGESYPLYLCGKRFGPKKMILKQVDLSECLLGNDGSMIQAKVAISLVEDSTENTTKASTTSTATASATAASSGTSSSTSSGSSSSSTTKSSSTSSGYSASSAYNAAMNATAKQTERERLIAQIQSRR